MIMLSCAHARVVCWLYPNIAHAMCLLLVMRPAYIMLSCARARVVRWLCLNIARAISLLIILVVSDVVSPSILHKDIIGSCAYLTILNSHHKIFNQSVILGLGTSQMALVTLQVSSCWAKIHWNWIPWWPGPTAHVHAWKIESDGIVLPYSFEGLA